MKVVNTQPFALIYSIVEHDKFGFVIEPHAVQVNSLGRLTLLHQRLFTSNMDYYESKLDDNDRKLVKIYEEMDQEKIVKRYSKKSKRPAEFFKNEFNESLFKKFIRPFIERKLLESIELLVGKEIYLMGRDGNPSFQKIELADEKASVLFHFRRDDLGTNYFPTIKYKGENVHFKGQNGFLLVNQPAWVVTNGMLFSFEKNVDGNKLRPFFAKKFIHIPKSAEAEYFQKFVVPLLEKYDVYAVGFEIVSNNMAAEPVITVDNAWGEETRLNLQFRYEKELYPYHSSKKVSVYLQQKGDNFTFVRLRRNKELEEEKRQLLEKQGLKLLQGSSFVVEKGNREEESVNWINNNLELLKSEGFSIEQHGDNRFFIGARNIELLTHEEGDWFDIRAVVKFGQYEIPFVRLRKYLLEGIKQFELPNGEIAVIPEEWFAEYSELMHLSRDAQSIKLHRHHWQLLEDLPLGPKAKESLNKLNDKSLWEIPIENEVTEDFKGELRPYQKEGYEWFYFLNQNGFGGCLADDMGLGKTIQTLALLANEKARLGKTVNETVYEQQEVGAICGSSPQISLFASEIPSNVKKDAGRFPVNLVVVPTSLIYNWAGEAIRFIPNFRVLIHTGQSRSKNIKDFEQYDLIICTYGVVRQDIDLLKQFYFHYIILDESQAIKNPASLTTKTVKELRSRHKLVLTGTPIENTITDLWSQMNFVNPGLLGNYTYFNDKFVVPIERDGSEQRREKLRKLIAPFVLRRTKKQVATDLPDKYEQIQFCEMTEEQQKLYDETKSMFRNRIMQTVKEVGMQKSKLQILKGLILLRQIANHPRLVDDSFLGESGKFLEITRMLETALEEGHKVLLFSQFVKHLKLFREYAEANNIPYCYLDGSVTGKNRMNEVDRFNKSDDVRLFLISLKAGGTGLNLTSADYVFLADPWWNPAVERQAIDRTHRIGQTQKVFSYKYISKDSIEEKILKLQEKKNMLAEELIESDENILKSLEIEDMEELLS